MGHIKPRGDRQERGLGMAIVAPPGAEALDVVPKAAALNKLLPCLTALGMEVSTWTLGGGEIAVLGLRGDIRMAIEARFEMGVTPKGGVSCKFVAAKVLDPIGIVTNLEFDYSIGPKRQKELHMLPEQAEKRGNYLNHEYNDGAQFVSKMATFSTSGAMNEWLDEWLDTLKIDHKRQSPKKKPKPTNLDLMMGAQWTG